MKPQTPQTFEIPYPSTENDHNIEDTVLLALQRVCQQRGIVVSKFPEADRQQSSDITNRAFDQGSSGGTGRQYRYIVELDPTYDNTPKPKPQPQPELEQAPVLEPDRPENTLANGLEAMANALADILSPPAPKPRLENAKNTIEHQNSWFSILNLRAIL